MKVEIYPHGGVSWFVVLHGPRGKVTLLNSIDLNRARVFAKSVAEVLGCPLDLNDEAPLSLQERRRLTRELERLLVENVAEKALRYRLAINSARAAGFPLQDLEEALDALREARDNLEGMKEK